MYIVPIVLQKPDVSLKCFLGSWKFDILEEFGNLLLLWGCSFGCYCTSEEISFLYPKMTFGHAEFVANFF